MMVAMSSLRRCPAVEIVDRDDAHDGYRQYKPHRADQKAEYLGGKDLFVGGYKETLRERELEVEQERQRGAHVGYGERVYKRAYVLAPDAYCARQQLPPRVVGRGAHQLFDRNSLRDGGVIE